MDVEENVPLIPKDGVDQKISKGRQTVMLGACMYLHFISLGFTVSLGVLYVELIRYFDTQHSLAALVQSVYQGLTYMGGIVFSGLVAKYGVGLPVMFASLCGASAMLFSVWSVNIYMVIVTIGIVCGACMGINYLCAFVAVGWTFGKHRRAALASLTMATAIGQTVLPNIVEVVISSYGWPGALMVASGLMLNGVPCGLILYMSRKHFSRNQDNAHKTEKIFACRTKIDAGFIIFAAVCTIYPGIGAVEAWFIVDMTDQRGYGREAGTVLLSLLGLFGLVGRLLGTLFLKCYSEISAAIPYGVAFEVFALGHFLVISLTDYYGMMGGIVVRGISAGLLMCFLPGMLIELRGIARFPKTMAIVNFLSGIVQIGAGYLGGAIFDLTGGYDIAFYIAVWVCVACGLCLFAIKCLINRP